MPWPLDPGFGSAVPQRLPARRPAYWTTNFSPSRSFARVKPSLTLMRRGRLPHCCCRHVRVDGLERLSGRNASPSGITPSNILSPARRTEGSWTEVRLGARAQTTCIQRAHAPPRQRLPTEQTLSGRHLTPRRRTSKAAGNRDVMVASSRRSSRITGRIPGVVPGRESGLTRSGEPVKRKKTMTPEPEDKLDAATASAVAVSGPEDAALRWRQVDWRRVEADVRRLRQRIFAASKAGDLPRVRRLQKLMLRSRSNTLVSVRRVTERNAGRLTAGVDGEVVLTPEAKLELVSRIQHATDTFKAMPVRRVYIPKPGGKQRPLGIPPARRSRSSSR